MEQDVHNSIPSPRRERARHGFSHVEFVVAWETSSTVSEVAEKLMLISHQHVSDKTASDRAAYLWKKGVPLKRMRRVFPSHCDNEQITRLFQTPAIQTPAAQESP